MAELVYSCVFDGSSDGMLRRPIEWLLQQHASAVFHYQAANLAALPSPPRRLRNRIAQAVSWSECDLLFIHRDAEASPASERLVEIKDSAAYLRCPWVPIVPIRMTEAWLLFDVAAIRRAAGNPAGRVRLDIPAVRQLEEIPDPKAVLHDALRIASELTGRRRVQFDVFRRQHRVAELIDDFAPLRQLTAFAQLESDVRDVLSKNGWDKRRGPLRTL